MKKVSSKKIFFSFFFFNFCFPEPLDHNSSLDCFLGSAILKNKTGVQLRSVVGALQEETVAFRKQCDTLQDKGQQLRNAFQNLSFCLHEFATAIVGAAKSGPSDQVEQLFSNSGEEQNALLETADSLNVMAASMKIIEDGIKERFLLPFQQVKNIYEVTFEPALHEAAEAKVELESEGKKTAAQMSKKHAQAERRMSDVAFGDLLKIQQSLKTVEKKYETAATTHLATMLKLRSMRRTAVVGNVLHMQKDFEEAFGKSAARFGDLRKKTQSWLDNDLVQYSEKWEAETPVREQEIARVISHSCYGTNKHIEGYLNVTIDGRSGRKYFVVSDGKLTQYPEWSDYKVEQEMDLLLFTVKLTEGTVTGFELQSPMAQLFFEAPNETKRNKWVAVCGENISNKLDAHKQTTKTVNETDEIAKQKIIDSIRSIEGNAECADCDSTDPTWISLNYGVVICHQCSGVHRKIGTHLSKVRSLTLDVIDDELRDFMLALGNKKANSFLESTLDKKKPTSGSKREVREEFIVDKYANRLFCVKTSENANTLACILFDSLQTISVEEALKYILMGVNLKWKHAETKQTLLGGFLLSRDEEFDSDPYIVTQLLIFNDCLLDEPFGEAQLRPLHVAAQRNYLATCRVLLRNSADPDAQAATGETALDLLPESSHPSKASAKNIQHYLFPNMVTRSRSNTLNTPPTPVGLTERSSPVTPDSSTLRKGRRLSFFQKKTPGSPASSPSISRRNTSRTPEKPSSGFLTRSSRSKSQSSLESEALDGIGKK